MVVGEIACVDKHGRLVFRDLLFRRRRCVFVAFLSEIHAEDEHKLAHVTSRQVLFDLNGVALKREDT